MKIRVKFKDPDTMPDAVTDAFHVLPCPSGISEKEWDALRKSRAIDATSEIAGLWMEYGEYLDVEFDLDAKTATVLPSGSIR